MRNIIATTLVLLACAMASQAITSKQAAIYSKAAATSIQSITIPSSWGSDSCSDVGSGCTTTSVSKTLTVPAGNSGVIKFTFTSNVDLSTWQYSTDGSTFTTVSNNATVTFTNGQTLYLRANWGNHCGIISNTSTMTATDNTTSATIGTEQSTENIGC